MTALTDQIEFAVRANPNGIALPALLGLLEAAGIEKISERTLRRRLASLVKAKRIARVGERRGTRYFPLEDTPEAESEPDDLPVSRQGMEIRKHVRQPLSKRTPVGYNEQFIRDYNPGQTWYLESSTRAHLRQVGEVIGPMEPAGTFARHVLERLLVDLAWSSSRLEGNTYSRLDTENLLERGQRAAGKDARETQMILNHKKAIEMLVDGAQEIRFNRYTLLNLHAALSENLLNNPEDEGRIRHTEVGITGTTFIPLSIPQKLNELFDLLLTTVDAIPDPFEQAFFVMVHLPYLQPFIDVNKRTSRLAANIPLITQNLCPLSFVEVPERTYVDGTLGVYERNRPELLRDLFVWAYERSALRYRIVHDSVPQPDPIRLRYRQQLTRLVQDAVRMAANDTRVYTAESLDVLEIAQDDREAFASLVRSTLETLHEGAIARYGLLPSEFQRWRSLRVPRA